MHSVNPMDLSGRVALVTGGAGGLGKGLLTDKKLSLKGDCKWMRACLSRTNLKCHIRVSLFIKS